MRSCNYLWWLPAALLLVVALSFGPAVTLAQNGARRTVVQNDAPANPQATQAVRNLLTYFQQQDSCSVISGQNIGHGEAAPLYYQQLVDDLATATGERVGIVGVDYYSFSDRHDYATFNQPLITHWQQGGLVTVSWSAPNPWTGGDSWDLRNANLDDLINPNKAIHATWLAHLDEVAAGLAQLREAGVVVLWRPLHEMNGDWFWWGAATHPGNAAPYKALWQQMFDYFSNTKGLDNLLWVYSAAGDQFGRPAIDFYYPGTAFVDLVGQDVYDDKVEGVNYSDFLALGKPFALTEFGPHDQLDGSFDYRTLINQLRARYPRTVYWLSWHDWTENNALVHISIMRNRNAQALLQDPCVVNQDEIVLAPQATATPSATPTRTPTRAPVASPATSQPPAPAQSAFVHRVATAPTIDGTIDAVWANAVTYTLTNYLVGGTPSSGDLAGSFRLLYDSQHLYVLVDIVDSIGKNDSGADWWEDDGIEIYLDGNHSRGSRYDGVNDFQFGFRWHDDTLHIGSNSAPAPSGITASHVDTNNGDRLEVAFPLAALGLSAVDGALLGLEVHLNDDDDGGARDRKLTWHATVDDAWENPGRFGTAQLVGNATPTATFTPVSIATPTPTASRIVWQRAGFGGAGAFVTLHFDPKQADIVYATSDVAGVFRSNDGGQRWEMRSLGLGNYEVSSFAVDPFDVKTLYAGVGAFANSNKAGLYISHDAGLSWQHLQNTAANGIDFRVQRTVNAIAPDPHQQGVIVTGSRSKGLWRSTNGGNTWSQVLAPPITNVPPFNSSAGAGVVDREEGSYPAPVMVARFDPATPKLVYAAFYGSGVFKSTQGGVAGSWQAVNEGLPTAPPLHDLVIAPNGTLYLATGQAGVYKSSNGGLSWQAVNGNLPFSDFHVLGLAVHPTDSNTLYLAQERVADATVIHEAIWRTTNGGTSWTEVVGEVATDPVNSPPDAWWFYPSQSWRVAVDPHKPQRLFYLLGGIYRSENGGATWHNSITGAQDTCVTDLIVDTDHPAGQPDTLFATHMDAGLLASTDNGASWQMVLPTSVAERDTLAGHYWRILITKSGSLKRYYTVLSPWAHDHVQILRSTDGITWQPIFTQPTPSGSRGLGQSSLAADPSQPGVLYFAQDGGTVFTSTNHGDTWQPTASQPEATAFNDLLVDEAGRLFAATFWQGLWRSTDGGASWARVLPERWLFGRLDEGGGAIYAGAEDGNLYQSRDGGVTWANLTNLPVEPDGDENGVQGVAVAVNPADPNHLLFSRFDGWHSSDAGGGILESRDGGQRWAALNDGLGYPRAGVMAFGSSGVRVAGTLCGGIWATTGESSSGAAGALFLPVIQR